MGPLRPFRTVFLPLARGEYWPLCDKTTVMRVTPGFPRKGRSSRNAGFWRRFRGALGKGGGGCTTASQGWADLRHRRPGTPRDESARLAFRENSMKRAPIRLGALMVALISAGARSQECPPSIEVSESAVAQSWSA